MTLRKRIGKLEGVRGDDVQGLSVIFLRVAETGEPFTAMLRGGVYLRREDGETVDAFRARAETGAAGAVYLADNGRDALATGKAPRWASGALVEKALREKHATG